MSKVSKTLSLALQGGGAHGAFTWGVLDALLEDGRIGIEALSGTSAGAMNAICLADGWIEGGAEGARTQLSKFWRSISVDGHYSAAQRTVLHSILGTWSETPFSHFWLDMMQKVASPYDLNPLDINPLRDVLNEQIDFERLRKNRTFKLFVTATNVQTGRIKVFERSELTADHVMARPACPPCFRRWRSMACPIGMAAIWAIPRFIPLFYDIKSRDILLVQINPVKRMEVPKTAKDIQNRLNEITFNATLLREYRSVDFVNRLLDKNLLPKDKYKHVLMHRIDADRALEGLDASTKLDSGWDFIQHLHHKGRATGQAWLANNFDALGVRATLDVHAEMG